MYIVLLSFTLYCDPAPSSCKLVSRYYIRMYVVLAPREDEVEPYRIGYYLRR